MPKPGNAFSAVPEMQLMYLFTDNYVLNMPEGEILSLQKSAGLLWISAESQYLDASQQSLTFPLCFFILSRNVERLRFRDFAAFD